MKKRLILIIPLLLIIAVCFIPVTSQRAVLVKATFFNTYQQLALADNWPKWRPDLRETWLADPSKILTSGRKQNFSISHDGLSLYVTNVDGYSFNVQERNNTSISDYQYTVVPQNPPNHTQVIATERKSAFRYIIDKLGKGGELSETHIDDFKHYMETPDLYYGFPIRKIQVPDTCMIGLTKTVLTKDKYTEAKAMLNALRQYAASNHLQQTNPFIGQYIQGQGDSVRLKIGLPVNRKVKPAAPFLLMTMPEGGHWYTIVFNGKFADRQKAYSALYQYYHDTGQQLILLPFDTFLDNKLPDSDTSKVHLRINFSTY